MASASHSNGHDHAMAGRDTLTNLGFLADPGKQTLRVVQVRLLYKLQGASVTRSDAGRRWNGYTTFLTTGAGSWGETADSCGSPGSYLYSNGGEAATHSKHYKRHMPDLIDWAAGVINLKGAVELGRQGASSALDFAARVHVPLWAAPVIYPAWRHVTFWPLGLAASEQGCH